MFSIALQIKSEINPFSVKNQQPKIWTITDFFFVNSACAFSWYQFAAHFFIRVYTSDFAVYTLSVKILNA